MSNPTHAFIDEQGNIQCVYPTGYSNTEGLVNLPTDFFERGWYKWNNGFVDDLDNWRKSVIKKANNRRDALLYGGCETPVGVVDTNSNSRNMLYTIKLESLINDDPNYSVDITLQNNSSVPCDKTDIDSIITSIRSHDQETHTQCQETKQTALNSNVVIEGLI